MYIGSIKETISSDKFISAIDGRSSIGRLGMQVHLTAGFGDIGFSGKYTCATSKLGYTINGTTTVISSVYLPENPMEKLISYIMADIRIKKDQQRQSLLQELIDIKV